MSARVATTTSTTPSAICQESPMRKSYQKRKKPVMYLIRPRSSPVRGRSGEERGLMRYITGFFRFWYDFLIGDSWQIALGVVLVVVATRALIKVMPQLAPVAEPV